MDTDTNGKMILFHGLSQDEIKAIINFIRSSIDPERTIACSMTVDNVMEWPVKELIAHVLEEHTYMKAQETHRT
ncbi:MAG TPA: DUF3783 domain-containing protein [Spirochaetia bacterium]|nr:DUF3783 domain-containing protein [Spirochaetales bacterium]HPD80276.1 DUF3783 domain-containing protein [Spirochaetales bacterium]HQK35486.1 DUF3783 domain-containing protein [Spirochaetales bacterium]HRS65974.1 DUF3783 domain-containing protein [Spirochaetia bacterium]HRV27217.1 DUF3783 domain-containing protein [Spirochaetia bacterium]